LGYWVIKSLGYWGHWGHWVGFLPVTPFIALFKWIDHCKDESILAKVVWLRQNKLIFGQKVGRLEDLTPEFLVWPRDSAAVL
jgi:hypothetical protein